MYAVIFKATIKELTQEYKETAERMRVLAREYGCIDFVSVTEGDQEIAISYWENTDQITQWKDNPEHQQAQQLGKTKWYQSYQVQVVEVCREYSSESSYA